MAKIIADYRDYVREAMKAFDEGRVHLVSHGGKGLPNVMAIGGNNRNHMAKAHVCGVGTSIPSYVQTDRRDRRIYSQYCAAAIERGGTILWNRVRSRPQQV